MQLESGGGGRRGAKKKTKNAMETYTDLKCSQQTDKLQKGEQVAKQHIEYDTIVIKHTPVYICK